MLEVYTSYTKTNEFILATPVHSVNEYGQLFAFKYVYYFERTVSTPFWRLGYTHPVDT